MSKTAVYWGVRMKRSRNPLVIMDRLKRCGAIHTSDVHPTHWTWQMHPRQFEAVFTTPQRRPSKGLRKHTRRVKKGKIAP